MGSKVRMVVVGGGYAGVRCALRARRLLGARGEVVLLSSRDTFVERIRLHEEVASGGPVARPLVQLLAEADVTLVVARALGVDTKLRRLLLPSGSPMAYDGLVLATGSVVDVDRVPGARPCGGARDTGRRARREHRAGGGHRRRSAAGLDAHGRGAPFHRPSAGQGVRPRGRRRRAAPRP